MLTVERLRELLDYNPNTGLFMWKSKSDPRSDDLIGHVAGDIKPNGYRFIGIAGRRYRAHRLAWFYVTGEWPEHQIDHENLNRSDNRWSNIRAATPSQNMANKRRRSDNTSGYKGVFWHKGARKWYSQIQVRGNVITLGLFNTAESAHQAYANAASAYFEEFARC